jgi:hypothetical protein
MIEIKDNRTPLIIFLDIDGTIVGDVSNKADEWCIVKDLNKYIKDNKVRHRRIIFNVEKLQKDLIASCLRPGLASFVSTVTAKCGPVEFFIYTASTSEWAKFLIKQIEHIIKVTFNRPIFARPDCVIVSGGVLNKSINKVLPAAKKALSKRYTNDALNNASAILIDNTDVGEKHMIHCPTYRGKSPITMMNIEAIIMNPEVDAIFYRLISQALNIFVNTEDATDYMTLRDKLYIRKMYSVIASDEINVMLATPCKDSYWKALGKVLCKISLKRDVTRDTCEKITFAAINLCKNKLKNTES